MGLIYSIFSRFKWFFSGIAVAFKWLVGYLYAAINIFVPRDCIICSKELRLFEKHLCTSCLADIPLSYSHLYSHSSAEELFYGRVKAEFVLPLMIYRGEYKRCLFSIKYKGNKGLGIALGKMLGNTLLSLLSDRFSSSATAPAPIDYIVPVPLHWRKRIKRGYNQAHIIAQGIVKSYRQRGCKPPVILHSLIRRRAFTATQTTKDRFERWRNVASAFQINRKALKHLERLQAGTQKAPHHSTNAASIAHTINTIQKTNAPQRGIPHFLIVDDVLTTGATIEACAQVLLHSLPFPCRLSIATLAYVP